MAENDPDIRQLAFLAVDIYGPAAAAAVRDRQTRFRRSGNAERADRWSRVAQYLKAHASLISPG